MNDISNKNSNYALRIWFDPSAKQEYYQTRLLNIGNIYKISSNVKSLYDTIKRNENKNLKTYKLKEQSISSFFNEKPYKEKIGACLIAFLNTDFTDFYKAYTNFFGIYGYDFLYNYSEYELYEENFETEEEALNILKSMFERGINELVEIQNNFRNAVEFIFDLCEDKSFIDYSYETKFLVCMTNDKYGFVKCANDIDIESNLMNYEATQFANSNKSIKDIEKMGLSIHLSNRYLVNSLDTLMYIILHEVVSNSLIIKKCQICGKYFIPNKSNEIYCEFLNEENNTICRNVGAFQVYKQNLENTPALLEYRRTYNRKSNEVSRDKENVKLKEDFKEWRKGAQEKIKEFKQNKITEDDLNKWMSENK